MKPKPETTKTSVIENFPVAPYLWEVKIGHILIIFIPLGMMGVSLTSISRVGTWAGYCGWVSAYTLMDGDLGVGFSKVLFLDTEIKYSQ